MAITFSFDDSKTTTLAGRGVVPAGSDSTTESKCLAASSIARDFGEALWRSGVILVREGKHTGEGIELELFIRVSIPFSIESE